ncbi:MAG TPA: aminotransferase DegT, partial [Elusimicrobia bacterium]|nr:aminotransferase DegT [Elusimicrobiota bacterium]
IEDCAQALGAKYKSKMVGGFGNISIFSFYATKMLTCGEGGMLLSNSEKILRIARDLRDYDEKEDYSIRYNYKMTDLQAALGLGQLDKLSFFIRRRKEIVRKYNFAFQKCNFKLPLVSKEIEPVFYRYVVKTKNNLKKYLVSLKKRRIVCRRPIYKPLHQYFQLRGLPNTEKAWATALSIPIYPALR